MELTAIKIKKYNKEKQVVEEVLIAAIIPKEGVMSIMDVANLLDLRTTVSLSENIKRQHIKHYKVGRKVLVDLEDFWLKNERVDY
ncbi:hypothetical protein KAW18_02285 [candidate division WOR-3 bacterium]|nr:hypothetical protein [candidate division WOR-3 bacterium]